MAKFPNGGTAEQVAVWLEYRGVGQSITNALLPVLEQMWRAALQAGAQAGNESAGTQQQVAEQEYQDILAQLKRQWLRQVVTTTITLMARALTSAAFTAVALAAALAAALANLDRARKIAQTEITRAMAIMAQRIYYRAGHRYVRWITEHDARVCPNCEMNEAAGDWPLGVPFPSGAPYPPDHPNCRCAVVPAKTE